MEFYVYHNLSYAFIAIYIFKAYRKQKTLNINASDLEKKINAVIIQVGHVIKTNKAQNAFFMEDSIT